jgi:anti-sigma-K factor RskA
MTDFEDQLREALRRPEVPAGFANRVLAKLPEAYPAQAPRPVWRRVALWAAAVLVVAASVTGWQVERARDERARGEKAREQVMLALRITGKQLNHAESRVRQVTVDDGPGNGER